MTPRTLAAGAMIVLASPLALADCKPVVGRFEARVLPVCQPGAILCTEGRVWGGIQGQYHFDMTNGTSAGALGGIAAAVFFVGESKVTLKDGTTVDGIDSGTLDFGQGGFASLISFGERGEIRLRGDANLPAGITSGDYSGTFCTP